MSVPVYMEEKDLVFMIDSLKQQLNYWMDHGMKNCYMETLDMLDKAEDMYKNILSYRDTSNRIPAVDFRIKTPEALKEIQDKEEAEKQAERERRREERMAAMIAHQEAQKKAREDLERRYMLAFMTRGVPSTMKDRDIIIALKRAPPVSEEEARMNARMAELSGLF